MGKCVSKHPSTLTISQCEQDLPPTTDDNNQIWSTHLENVEHTGFKDEHHVNRHLSECETLVCTHKDGDNQRCQQTETDGDEIESTTYHCKASERRRTAETIEHDDGINVMLAGDMCIIEDGVLIDDKRILQNRYNNSNNIQNRNNNNGHHSHKNGQYCLDNLRLCRKEQWQQTIHVHSSAAIGDIECDENCRMATAAAADVDDCKDRRNILRTTHCEEDTKKSSSVIVTCKQTNENEERQGVRYGKQTDDYIIMQSDKHCKGQTESKKSSKKHADGHGTETKGTAMSFGFRKKLNTTPKKLRKLIEGDTKKKQHKDKCNNISADDEQDKTGTVITDNDVVCNYIEAKDDNGNAETIQKIHFEKVGPAGIKVTPQPIGGVKDGPSELIHGNHPGAGNRFGYRGRNIQRPASAGVSVVNQNENADNNNSNGADVRNNQETTLESSMKRRSKSAHAGRSLPLNRCDQDAFNDASTAASATPKIAQPKTITFNLNQNSTIEYQRQQFFQPPAPCSRAIGRAANIAPSSLIQYQQQQKLQPNIIHSGNHTNAIFRPTPRTPLATYSKFTLQTVSLPRPEFAVAISLNATTPTTPASIYSPSPISGASASATTSVNGSCGGARSKNPSAHKDAPQHPLTEAQTRHIDPKTAKQMANNTRRGFTGSREISADSGICSMDVALDSSTSSGGGGSAYPGRTSSPKRSRSRPRNLQMVMNGRHKFEIRDLDERNCSESNSIVEPLTLPKLPSENQTVPLPLSGLVRSNTVLSREAFAHKQTENAKLKSQISATSNLGEPSEESESIDEEKLYLDRSTSEKCAKMRHTFKDINTCSSKASSPGSSMMSSWCNAGESLAVKDCSSLSISSSEGNSNRLKRERLTEEHRKLDDEDLSTINTDMQISTISSITELLPMTTNHQLSGELDEIDKALERNVNVDTNRSSRPKSFYNALNETKFAEMALAGSTFLLDDETSPTDSLVSSTESEEVGIKQKKHKINEELQEKDIDEISPEVELCSPISPGTPTHASHSLSLSDCGNLIDDEIADQPALLFNNESGPDGNESHASRKETPTLMESCSMRNSILRSQNKGHSALHQAMELSLRTPLSLRKAVMERAESLDTLSPCESICSDDLMMDFEINSSMDSIRSTSMKSRSGSDLHNIDDTELFSELERKGSDVMKELNSILRVHSNRNIEKDSIIAHLPARATRLLNRTRLQPSQQQPQCALSNVDSDHSSKSAHSTRRSATASRTSSTSTATGGNTPSPLQRLHQRQQQLYQQRNTQYSSSDDLMLYDKSFRNAMIQDVLQFKKQLLRLRRILQETETLNPFENDNGALFAHCGLDPKYAGDLDLVSLTSSTTDDPMQELADLRRQVVYLQGQVDDRDRTIRLQKNLIEKLEAEKLLPPRPHGADISKECINSATQTERTRPLSMGPDGLSRSKPEYTSYTTHFPAICSDSTTIIQQKQHANGNDTSSNHIRRHTIISTTLTNYNHQLSTQPPRRASIAGDPQALSAFPSTYKPVKITLIGEPLKKLNGTGEHKRQTNGVGGGGESVCSMKMSNQLEAYHHHQQQQQKQRQLQQQQRQQQHQQQQQQLQQQSMHLQQPHHMNGKLNPTVTIV